MQINRSSKYRAIIGAVTLFVLFTVSVLAINFYLSMQIGADASMVNLAGRQRTLTQRMAKNLLAIRLALERHEDFDAPLDDLREARYYFDNTLTGFRRGGMMTGPNGNLVLLDQVLTERGRSILFDTAKIWQPINSALDRIVSFSALPYETPEEGEGKTGAAAGIRYSDEGQVFLADVDQALEVMRVKNKRLYNLMSSLTEHLDVEAVRRSKSLRGVQIGGISLSLVLFFIIVFYFIRNLRKSDAHVERARKETEDILGTVTDGLFLLNRQFKIGSQYSRAMERIFRRKRFAALKFERLLKQIVPEKTLTTALDYVGLLFGNRVNEKLIRTLNPLNEVEVHFEDGLGGFQTHYLEFEFNRVTMGQQIHHVLVTVNDVTDRVLLSRELEDSKRQTQAQLDLLMEILHVEPAVLTAFLGEVETGMAMVNAILQKPADSHGEYQEKVEDIFRQVHGVKGDAAGLGLTVMESKAHAFEDMLADLRDAPNLTGNDFLPLTVRLDDLLTHVTAMQGLVSKLADLRAAINKDTEGLPEDRAPPPPSLGTGTHPSLVEDVESDPVGANHVATLQLLAARTAANQSKKVALRCIGLDSVTVPESYRKALKDITVQMLRNSITHGIEEPPARLAAEKPEAGSLHVEFRNRGAEGFELIFFDDGRGLSAKRIRETAVNSGLLSREQAAGLETPKLWSLIFRPGFSTSGDADADSGRGVGMDIVRNLVTELGGSVRLSTMEGHNTQFRVFLPAVHAGATAAA